jgi:hypothetical protein
MYHHEPYRRTRKAEITHNVQSNSVQTKPKPTILRLNQQNECQCPTHNAMLRKDEAVSATKQPNSHARKSKKKKTKKKNKKKKKQEERASTHTWFC